MLVLILVISVLMFSCGLFFLIVIGLILFSWWCGWFCSVCVECRLVGLLSLLWFVVKCGFLFSVLIILGV